MMEANIVNRFWVRILVFCGLLGAAGALWGVVEAFLFTHGLSMPGSQEAPAIVGWAALLSLLLVIYAAWISIRVIVHHRLPALGDILLVLMFSLYLVGVPTSVALALSGQDFLLASAPPAVLMALCASLGVYFLVKSKSHRISQGQRAEVRIHWPSLAVCAALAAVTWTLGRAVLGADTPLYPSSAVSGLSILFAKQLGYMAAIRFPAWLMQSVVAGGAVFTWLCVFMVIPANSSRPHMKILRAALLGFGVGAVASAIMFQAQALTLLLSYANAADSMKFLPLSTCIWTSTGLILGLLLTIAVEVKRKSTLRTLIPLAVVLALGCISASVWTWRYIAVADAGRDLLARAAVLENTAFGIDFWLHNDRQPRVQLGNIAVRIRAADAAESKQLGRSYRWSVRLCDELLRLYPHSAYRPAALQLKAECAHYDWNPDVVLATIESLQSLYRHSGYDSANDQAVYRATDLLLTGQYTRVLQTTIPQSDYGRRTLRGVRAGAAEILGEWDEAVGMRRAIILEEREYLRERPHRNRGYLTRLESHLHKIEGYRSRHAPPMPLANAVGRVLMNGHPLPNSRVGLAIAGRIPTDHLNPSLSALALSGGRVATTDSQGVYRIIGMPEGRYEVFLVLDPDVVHLPINVRAPGVPYEIRGRAGRLPDIVLTPKPTK